MQLVDPSQQRDQFTNRAPVQLVIPQVAMPWKQDDQWRLPGGIECELRDVKSWQLGGGLLPVV